MTEQEFRESLQERYLKAGNRLEELNNTKFSNHCYWRMANDYAVGAKWDTIISSPFYKNASYEQLEKSVLILEQMIQQPELINTFNKGSLYLREQAKKNKDV